MTNTIRVRRRTKSKTAEVPSRVKKAIESIVEAQEQIADLQFLMKSATAEVIGYMEEHNLSHIDGVHATQMDKVIKKGRASSTIDPSHLYEICDNMDDFFDCVKVVQAKAKSILPGNALDKIKTIIPAKDTEVFVATRKD